MWFALFLTAGARCGLVGEDGAAPSSEHHLVCRGDPQDLGNPTAGAWAACLHDPSSATSPGVVGDGGEGEVSPFSARLVLGLPRPAARDAGGGPCRCPGRGCPAGMLCLGYFRQQRDAREG